MHTVLLVEDNGETKRLMRFLFELEGYRVVSTDTYEDVIPLLQKTCPDALLMDVHIQEKETIDLIREVRMAGGDLAETPVVMTSAMDCRIKCMRAGADYFILKPYLPDEVVQEVGSLCKQQCPGQEIAGDASLVPPELGVKLKG